MSPINIYRSNNPPSLPQDNFNQNLVNYQGKLRTVRTQDIKLTSKTIAIARIKIPAPDKVSSHLIKRFDTNAISASSFFRSAFPYSSEEEEAIHMNYLQEIYDTRRAGAVDMGPDSKLTGVWVPVENAMELAEEYGLTRFVAPLVATPAPNSNPTPSSPVPTKNAAEKESLSTQTPKAIHQSNQTDQTLVSRSSKRSRAGPLSFGNTSPSSFNLSNFNQPSTEIKKPSTHESRPTNSTGKDNAEKLASPNVLVAGYQKSPIKTMTVEKHERTEHEQETTSKQLIGTDEMVDRAKQEALQLFSDLKSSQTNVQSSKESPTKTMEIDSRTTSLEKIDKLNRKRSVDEVSGAEEVDEEAELATESSISRSFLPKLLWRRSATQSQSNSKKLKRSNQTGSSDKSFVPLPANTSDPSVDQSLSPLNPNKRNLAIAGIVIAGAAASIAPYFF